MRSHWWTCVCVLAVCCATYRTTDAAPAQMRLLWEIGTAEHAGGYDAVEATRFGIEQSQPLVAVPCGAGRAELE